MTDASLTNADTVVPPATEPVPKRRPQILAKRHQSPPAKGTHREAIEIVDRTATRWTMAMARGFPSRLDCLEGYSGGLTAITVALGLYGFGPSRTETSKLTSTHVEFAQKLEREGRLRTRTSRYLPALISSSARTTQAVVDNVSAFLQDVEHQMWAIHGRRMVDLLQRRTGQQLKEHFSAWLRERCSREFKASGGVKSLTLQRYEDADQTLLDEFIASVRLKS